MIQLYTRNNSKSPFKLIMTTRPPYRVPAADHMRVLVTARKGLSGGRSSTGRLINFAWFSLLFLKVNISEFL